MAQERIVSPGVFTRENELSFLPQGIGNIGAVFIGPTLKGPAFVPTVIQNGFNEFVQKFGDLYQGSYVPYAVKEYLKNGGTATIIRVMNEGGYTYAASSNKLAAIASGSTLLTVFHPSKNNNDSLLDLRSSSLSPVSPSVTSSGFAINFSGSGLTERTYSASLSTTGTNYITRAVGISNDNSQTSVNNYVNTAFPYLNFPVATAAAFSGSSVSLVTSSADISFPAYTAASTPWIVSQYNGGLYKNLFKIHHLSHGDSTNTDIKIGITGLKEFSDADEYSTFSVVVRKFDDTDRRQVVLETFNNLNLNPDSPNYICRVIGDRYFEYSQTDDKVYTKGNYANKSAYIRIEVDPSVETKAYAPSLSPRGFEKLKQTIIGFPTYNMPTPSYLDASDFSTYSVRDYKGFDVTNNDNLQYLKTIPTIGSATSASLGTLFHVDLYFGHPSSSYTASLSASLTTANLTYDQLQFIVPLQGGSDGMSPTTRILTGEYIEDDNVFGFNCSTSSTSGSQAYTTALNIIANADEYDVNMVVTPGIIKALHSSVTTKATDICEERGDAFYIQDLTEMNDNISTAISEQEGIDSNYTAVWYPWVKILDTATNKPMFVPPSVVMPGVFAYNDKVAGEWWAPAGLNRGGIGSAIEAKTKLSQAERDNLYENRINPIAQFPGQGVCVWGQKTLEADTSAFDRINVRRLLIRLKKFVSSTSRYLVFDPNTTVTRNRFLSIVNPYMESVQSKQGVYSFKVVMDESNNTGDSIDRLELHGSIYLQPTKAAEFIIIDFNVTPTGATFSA